MITQPPRVRFHSNSSIWYVECETENETTTPSFPQVFLEQKKMLKTGLSIAQFRRYIPLIEKETIDYFERWGDSGQRGT